MIPRVENRGGGGVVKALTEGGGGLVLARNH